MRKNNVILGVVSVIIIVVAIMAFTSFKNAKVTNSPAPSQTATQKSDDNTPKTLESYFPHKLNVLYEYESQGNTSSISSYFNQKHIIVYAKDNTYQEKVVTPDFQSEYDSVIQINGDSVDLVYADNGNKHTDFIGAPTNTNGTILKTPLVVGTKWAFNKLTSNKQSVESTSEIVNMAVDVSVPYGKFSAMEVDTNYTNGNFKKDFYVQNIGLVKTDYSFVSKGEVSCVLKNILPNTKLTTYVDKSNYDVVKNNLVWDKEAIQISSNPDYTKILADYLKTALKPEYEKLFPTDTKINSIKISDDKKTLTLDLSSDFTTELKAGADIETQILQAIANTVGNFYGCTEVMITIDGKQYSTGHQQLTEPLKVSAPPHTAN